MVRLLRILTPDYQLMKYFLPLLLFALIAIAGCIDEDTQEDSLFEIGDKDTALIKM